MLLSDAAIKGLNIFTANCSQVIQYTNEYAPRFQVNTPLRLCHFMAQVCHESDAFRITEENMNYATPARLMAVWPGRFPTLAFAGGYIKNPAKLANYVYANRMGNGNELSGDGYKYRGRGPMQTTGKEMYGKLSIKMFNDSRLLTNPELLKDLKFGLLAAFLEWNNSGCNHCADADDIRTVTKKINGGFIGLEDRKLWLVKWKNKLL